MVRRTLRVRTITTVFAHYTEARRRAPTDQQEEEAEDEGRFESRFVGCCPTRVEKTAAS